MPMEILIHILGHSVVLFTILLVFIIVIFSSIHVIGPTEMGLVIKRFGLGKLSEDNPIAFNGEAGYQADMLTPGWRWKLWPVFTVKKFPWVQVPAGEIGVIISQVGQPLPIGAKSAVYKKEFANFTDLPTFIKNGGQKGVQRLVFPPGSLVPIHPVGFLVITKNQVYGVPVSPEFQVKANQKLIPEDFGLTKDQLNVVRIQPTYVIGQKGEKKLVDTIGIITSFEGEPLPAGDISSRLGGFKDIMELEKKIPSDDDTLLIEAILNNKNELHNNYQDFQGFLDNGGRIGLQHDPLLYGAYNLNPFLISVEIVPMLVIEQGEVAVIKSYVGLPTEDISGEEFKFGSLVRPGHRGIWQEPLRTGKYPINPRCYQAQIVPTSILTLNWAETTSKAHMLDANLESIDAKSREGFVFKIDLQVQIHIPDSKAPKVISIVGTIENLVSEVLQAAVGNHFRDKLQSMPAISFIETRQQVQQEAFGHIKNKLEDYHVETRGVYIQDVFLPGELVKVLTEREIAKQEIETFKRQQEAQVQRVQTEKAKGEADMQAQLAQSQVNIDIQSNNATALKAKADGEATFIRETGKAKGAEVEAIGLARARSFEAQVKAVGQTPTALVNIATVLAEKGIKIVPETLVTGGGGALDGLAARLIKYFDESAGAKNKS